MLIPTEQIRMSTPTETDPSERGNRASTLEHARARIAGVPLAWGRA